MWCGDNWVPLVKWVRNYSSLPHVGRPSYQLFNFYESHFDPMNIITAVHRYEYCQLPLLLSGGLL